MSHKLLPFLFVFLFVITSCGDDPVEPTDKPRSTSINKILPLGASRVEGDRPEFESFRFELWKLLTDGGWEFDYIGTMTDPASYPDYSGMRFDADHEGRGGWTSSQILSGIREWLDSSGAPDIVLFSSPGGNDALSGLPFDDAVSNINAVIDILQTENPNVTIIIEQMAPAKSDEMTPQLTAYFEQMQQEVLNIAAQQSTSTSKVLAVDMYTDFVDSFFADDVHYSEAGAQVIAERYYSVLDTVLKPE